MDCKTFIRKFHALDGTTLKQKKKSFHFLMKSITSSVLDAVIQELIPLTYLEESYKIEMLVHFKRTNDLLEMLMRGEEIGGYKIIRQDWFIKELMNLFTPTQFIKKIVPRLSLSVQLKIFKRIFLNVKSQDVIEEFFEETLNLYGIVHALIFLPGCSDEKVEDSLRNFHIHFSASQLKFLFNKNRDLIVKYFSTLIENGFDVDVREWKSFFSYMGKQDPLFYFEICETFQIDKQRLGKQSTVKYFHEKREEIIFKPYEYCKILRKDVLVRKLGKDFPLFYRNLLPDNIHEFKFCSAKSILKYYPKKLQYYLYLKTFTELYKESLWDKVEYMDQKLIEYISDRDEKEKWISKFENRQNIKKYLIKKKCAMFFIEDKEEIIIKDKKTVFNTLISTCKLTQNYEAFLNILKSFSERHRNSDVTVIYNFLRNIYKELDLGKFQAEHWQYIYDIIVIQLFKKQQIFHPIFVKYIEFKYLEKEPIDDHVITLINEAPLDLSKFNYNNYDFDKTMNVLFLRFLPKITNRKNEISIQIALSLMNWNSKHPKEYIYFTNQSGIIDSVIELASSETSDKIKKNVITVLRFLICRQVENQFSSRLDEVYWLNYEKLNDNSITNWFVKYKPEVFKGNINKILLILKNNNTNLIRCLKKYSHLGIPNSITTFCLQQLETSKVSIYGSIIKILICFMEKSDLHEYMVRHIPKDNKININVDDEKEQKVVSIRCSLAKYARLSENITKLLPVLLQYCKGYILSSSLSSLYSIFHRIPQNQVYSALEILNNQSASVRKHTIFLSRLVLPMESVLWKYKQVQSSESSFFVKQHMFTSCLKYFRSNESCDCWPIIKDYLEQLRKDQDDVLKMITNVNLFPKRYRAEYTEMVWNILDNFNKENVSIDDNMFALLKNLKTHDILRLNIEFCCCVIENKLYNSEEGSFDNTVSDFCRTFLLYFEKGDEKLESILKVIRRLREYSADNFKKHMDSLDVIHKFCFTLFSDVLPKTDFQKVDDQFLKNFKTALEKLFSVEEIYEESIFLHLILLRIEKSNFMEILPGEMSKLFASSHREYGHSISKRFKSSLQEVLNILYPYDDSAVLSFLNEFLEDNMTSDHCALVIDLMPHISLMADNQTKHAYDKLLKGLNAHGQLMNILLYGKLKNL